MRKLIPLLIIATACGGTAAPETLVAVDGGASSGGNGASGSAGDEGGAGGREAEAGSAGEPVSAGAGGDRVSQAGAGGDPSGGAGGAGEPSGGAGGELTGVAGSEPSGTAGEPGSAGAGGEPPVAEAPPWKHCNGVICTDKQVCVSDHAKNRMCVTINDALNNCIPDDAAPTAILEKCAALRPECQQTWRKCGLMTYNDAGDHCGVYTHHPAGGGERWSCGPQP